MEGRRNDISPIPADTLVRDNLLDDTKSHISTFPKVNYVNDAYCTSYL